jgi:hypothetical protein
MTQIKILKMKNLILIAVLAITVYSCTSGNQNSVATADPHQFGVNIDSSANIDAIKATFTDLETFDTLSYVKKYADTAIFYDNLRKTNLAENVAMLRQFQASGFKLQVQPKRYVWGSHFNFKDGTEGDYVYSYIIVNFTKGDKTVEVVNFQGDKFNKDGKVIEEFIVYDQTPIMGLMK